ncbi:cytochrome P450 [Serendipita vermifera]|nr:cytochrome P450 [Serendipita vermifera]
MNDLTSRFLESPLHSTVVALTGASISYGALKGLKYMVARKESKLPYPPGPKNEPLIGTLRSFPKDHFFRHFTEWANLYGDIVYAPLPGMDVVVLNSYEVAQELLLKRPSSTAGRRIGYLLLNLMGWGWDIAFIQPGPNHSSQRKMLRKSIGPQRISSHNNLIEVEIARLMTALLPFKGNPARTIQAGIGRLVIKTTYGEKIWDEMGENLSQWNMDAMDLINEALFAVWLVDIFPSLRFLPSWVPGTRFKQLARQGSHLAEKIRYGAYERAKELYNAGTLGHCIANDLMEEFGQITEVQDAMAGLYIGEHVFTTTAIIAFIHALFLFPEVSKRVFEEIQAVTSGQRLPQITDRSQLPYTEAVWKEAIRWRPFTPIGIPHVNEQDEIINGYFIPKGTMIHQNNGLMLTDPRVWGDPEVFRPERFLEEEATNRPNPLVVIFGYGIRVCAGMYFADKVAFHTGVVIASLFDIVPMDGQSIPDPNTIEYSDGAFCQPIGFECQFVPRNKKAEQLLAAISMEE